jgi:hypothetical protein
MRANLMHIARLGMLTALLVAIVTIASCRMYSDNGAPIPSSNWTWMCADGSLAPDSGCPDEGDGGTAMTGGDDDDARRAR